MAIAVGRQTEMPEIFACIPCLHHRAEHNAVDEGIERIAFERTQQSGIIGGAHVFGVELSADARFAQKVCKVARFFFRRAFVHAVNEGHFLLRHDRRHAFVGEHHELFDHFVRNRTVIIGYGDRAVFVKNFRFFYVERHAAAALPRFF